ncbi:hypothetical protein BYT27DRAFT_7213259 [Phlegmacium glaucopus]|nr:hypothetical protein BYT27DRAFT_7213259 [Phlegmacium glaucopus]
MEAFDLPTLGGLHLIRGLCDGAALGAEAMAEFPSLHTLPHSTSLGHHGVNVHGTESRNKSVIIHIKNTYEDRKTQDIAREMSKAEWIEGRYSKQCDIVTGDLEVLLHVRPLKGLKRLECGAFVKEHEGPDKEWEQLRLFLRTLGSWGERLPKLSRDFPEGGKISFLGEHACGVAVQVSAITETALSVILAFFPSEKAEIDKFKDAVVHRKATRYHPSFKAAEMVGISGRALGKIHSSFMVITSDHQNNLGLGFEIRSEGKEGRNWDYSEKAVELLTEYENKFPTVFRCLDGNGEGMIKAADALPGPDPDGQVEEIKSWLKSKALGLIKKAIVKASQDRQYSNLLMLLIAFKTNVLHLEIVPQCQVDGCIDGVSGITLGNRCSQYRGSTVGFNPCLNLTDPHTSTNPKAPPPVHNNAPFKPRLGQYPAITPAPGQATALGFRPAPPVNPNQPSYVHIMVNPNRGAWRGGYFQQRMSKLFRLAQQECRLHRLSALITLVVEERLHEEAEVLFQDFVVVVGSFQGVIEVEGYREEVSAVEGLSLLFFLHRGVDVYQTDY